jgi:hypothetical protein
MGLIVFLSGLLLSLGLIGCTSPTPDGSPPAAGTPPAIISGSRAVVEEYLEAAKKADGQQLYALIAANERDDETPDSLRDTAADRYGPETTWEIVKVDERQSTSDVIVRISGAKQIETNPYRFTLTKESDAWRIVQSPELHEDDDDVKIEIK